MSVAPAPVEVLPGSSPVILAMPHTGTFVPPDVEARLNEEGLRLRDTDWHVEQLYEGLLPEATIVRATFHRYVIDANRDPSGASLYPGQNTTDLIPRTDFDNRPIWRIGGHPGERDIGARLAAFHRPYHEALEAQIGRIRALHGVALVYDCHSIRSRCPFLFEGELPILNIGTFGGRSCSRALEALVHEHAAASPFSSVLNGRFQGGWTTRHYGRPAEGVHAIQMEIAQRAYLAAEEPPFACDPSRAGRLREPWLRRILAELEAAVLKQGGA